MGKNRHRTNWYLVYFRRSRHGAVLRMADDKQAYTLTDRGTFLAYQERLNWLSYGKAVRGCSTHTMRLLSIQNVMPMPNMTWLKNTKAM
jgi:ABC-type tungstate transport system permease subunit